jgi:hypothetical protein
MFVGFNLYSIAISQKAIIIIHTINSDIEFTLTLKAVIK